MQIMFMGTPDFAVPCLDQLVSNGYKVVEVVTQPDRPKGRKREMTPPPVKVAAMNHQIPIFQPEKLHDQEAVEHILSVKPDLIVTAAYGQILPKEIIQLPKYGCINVHASLLPKYRGGAPIHKSIIDGETETGVTIMYMVEKLDAGDILTQVKVPIESTDTVGSVHDKLATAGSSLLLETIPKLINGELSPIKQDETKASFAWNIKREDEKIDWNKDAGEIYNQIRGLNPWPVAYTLLDDQVFKVWWADILDLEKKAEARSGTILEVSPNGIEVACGKGVLRLLQVQPAGKKRLSAADFVRGAGAGLTRGMIFS